ncbi:flagellar P-ring protein precursor [Parvularcula bermudensis HTCC2503]|uniref:Flagellar P-ring protein n=1 Tax=Parvularcula bermudensis (strain ATCC BAA-594 / HTCC2503 / KCTC 12087) TaxID=314260 RepID=E0TGK5_PARBH|nr:flagellar basal body P-ring protein FlgI [Parvularcula bermudensis]ADM09624.1 flagellar P-ring protein precursor [Parvularcula bermudensis HTCC2503]
MKLKSLLASATALTLMMTGVASAEVALRDLVDVEGVRGNDLIGYGLVVGLNGTGDTVRNSPYTEEALASLLQRLGVNVQDEDFRPDNVAAVMVTAELPAFARTGSEIDVTVSSIGDADDLTGGTLVMTPLTAANGDVYAVAQGPVLVSGFQAEGEAASITQGTPTAGTIPAGARVEREVDFAFGRMQTINLALKTPDFTTAARIEDALNARLGAGAATITDPGTVQLTLPSGRNPARVLSEIEQMAIRPSAPARVVIDQRSGTIVLGSAVRLSSVGIAQGNLSIAIAETPVASQPNAFGEGETAILPRTTINVNEGATGNVALIEETVSLADLVSALNALGVTPRETIDILKSLKVAGALHAELMLQ